MVEEEISRPISLLVCLCLIHMGLELRCTVKIGWEAAALPHRDPLGARALGCGLHWTIIVRVRVCSVRSALPGCDTTVKVSEWVPCCGRACLSVLLGCSDTETQIPSLTSSEKLWLGLSWQQEVMGCPDSCRSQLSSCGHTYTALVLTSFKTDILDLKFSCVFVSLYH